MRLSIRSLTTVVALAAAGAHAADQIKSVDGVLSCDTARLTGHSTFNPGFPPTDGSMWLTQTLTFASGPNPVRSLIVDPGPPRRLSSGGAGLSIMVRSWKCLQGGKDKIVMLWMSCQLDDAHEACHGETEWSRLLDTSGYRLDTGYVPQDRRYDGLKRKLGITPEGTALESVTGG